MASTYITFAKDIKQDDDSDGDQCYNYVHAKHVHIRQTRIGEQFLHQVHHRYGGKSKKKQQYHDPVQIVSGRVHGNVEAFEYDDSQQNSDNENLWKQEY